MKIESVKDIEEYSLSGISFGKQMINVLIEKSTPCFKYVVRYKLIF